MAKVMIVDNSSLMRDVLKNLLMQEGHQSIEAADSQEALRKYRSEKPAMVFTELILSEGMMDGMNVLKEIRKFDPSSKVVVVTSVKEKKEFDEARQLGARGYLTKPFCRDDIVNALNSLGI